MKILYLTYDGLTDNLGQSQILPYITGCSKAGHNYTIVSFEKVAQQAHVPQTQAIVDEAGIKWIPLSYTKSPPLLSTFKDIFLLQQQCARSIREENFDVVHCRSYVPAFVAFQLQKKFAVKVVFDIRGLWADERLEGGIWNAMNPLLTMLYRFIKKKESQWFVAANGLISLTKKGAIEIENITEKGRKQSGITVIPCCADESLFMPGRKNMQLSSELDLTDDMKIVGYVGSLGTWYMGLEMMQQYQQLRNRNGIKRFLWITNERPESIFNLADQCGVPRKEILIRKAGRNDVPAYINLMDLGIFYIRPTYSKLASSPTKLAEFLLSGVPVITNTGIGDVDELMAGQNLGYCHVLHGDATLNGIPEEVLQNLLLLSPEAIRNNAIQTLSLTAGVQQYLAVYEAL